MEVAPDLLDELEELTLETELVPEIGRSGLYESQDKNGNWWDITITADNGDGTYCGDVGDGRKMVSWTRVKTSNIVEKLPSVEVWQPPLQTTLLLLVDVMCMTLYIFWYHVNPSFLAEETKDIIWWTVIGLSVLWRIRLFKKRDLPFSCIRMDVPLNRYGRDVDVYLCGTMHISPGSVTDTREAIITLQPDVVMIELDEDRLAEIKSDENGEPDVQPFELELQINEQPVVGVNAEWNTNVECVDGAFGLFPTIVEPDNPYGDSRSTRFPGDHVYVCRRGKDSMYVQTIRAEKRGASGVIIIDNSSLPSVALIDAGGLFRSCCDFFKTHTVALPNIPTFLIKDEIADGAYVEALLKHDELPKPYTFGKKLCRCVVVFGSGIGILYGIIRKAGVKVGHEFLTAEKEAAKQGIPCVCIDMNVGTLGGKLKKEIMPTLSNIVQSVLFLLSLPRLFVKRILFPIRDMDIFASMMWALVRFKPRTWAAFIVAGFLSSFIVRLIIMLPGFFIGKASDHIAPSYSMGSTIEAFFPLAFNLYVLPAVYRGLLDSRDEEMYRGIASQVRRRKDKKTFVAVVGAAHVNGIMHRGRTRGL